MFDQSYKKLLHEGEELVLLLRESLLAHPIKIFFGVLLAVLPFFLLFPLLRFQQWGVVGLVTLVAVALYYNLRLGVLWELNVFMITNRRIIDIDQRGIFSRRVSEVSFAKIQDIRYNRVGFFATLLNIGDVIVQSGGSEQHLEIAGVRHPEVVKEAIVKIQEQFSNSRSENQPLTAEELIQFIGRIKRYLKR